jgi:hypothetical protein
MNDIEIDYRLCHALGKRPGESLLDAAERAARGPAGPARRAAGVLLKNDRGDPWGRMRAAYVELCKPYVASPCSPIGLKIYRRCAECLREGRANRGRQSHPAVDGDLCALHAARKRRAEWEESNR